MYIFKTSGLTFDSVIRNQKHAYSSMPQDWSHGELILVSKNCNDCDHSANEKQIQYTMRFVDIRYLQAGEAEKYWPRNNRNWKHLVICNDRKMINLPFNLKELISKEDYEPYWKRQTFRKIEPSHEKIINNYLEKVGTFFKNGIFKKGNKNIC